MLFIIKFILLFVLSSASYLELGNLDDKIGKVIHVSLIYRHGERTPTWRAPNDPYNSLKYWPEGFGQLTKAGKLHHYRLGKWLRKRYDHLIEDGRFNIKTICTLSTDYDRTLMSAQVNLAGMFPPKMVDRFTNLDWEPIPVHSTSLPSDKILAMEELICKNYDEDVIKFENSWEYKQLVRKFVEMYPYLSESTQSNITNIYDLQYIYNTLLIEDMANLKLPAWTNKVYPKFLEEAADLSFSLPTYTTKMKRLKSGPLLKKILSTFDEKVRKGELEKCSNITAYSAHDDVVANFLNTVGVFNNKSPPFAALILFELRKSLQNKYYVTILYKNSTDPSTNPHILNIPQCGPICSLVDLKTQLQPVIPEDWDKECQE